MHYHNTIHAIGAQQYDMDANVLQQHKENIAPLPVGRSASSLGKALGEVRSRTSLAAQRDLLEAKLLLDELDDPLQEYVNYIEWIHNHYPQGANAESGLLTVLERCTSFFRDADHYKNDPRYLKVWLEYAAYSDSPRDVFVYLAKKRIGCELALYYEEFARFLEVRRSFSDAKDVYEVGLSRSARPLARLKRSLAAFSKRMEAQPAQLDENWKAAHGSGLRQILGKRPSDRDASEISSEAFGVTNRLDRGLKKRVVVYGDQTPVSIKDEVFKSDDNAVLEPLGAAKENKIAAKPWNGEVLRQNLAQEKAAAKFLVFRDTPEAVDSGNPRSGFELVQENGQYYTMIRNPGKAPERLAVNLNLLYTLDEELCLAELLGLLSRQGQRSLPSGGEILEQKSLPCEGEKLEQRRTTGKRLLENEEAHSHRTEKPKAQLSAINNRTPRQIIGNTSTQNFDAPPNQEAEQTHTFTIPLRDGSATQPAKSPTMTLFSRVTTNEVLGMFNDAALNFQLDDESTKTHEEPTNYDGFVTETIQGTAVEHAATPPTDHYDSGSSPFLERP